MRKSIYLVPFLFLLACNDPNAKKDDNAEMPITAASPVAAAVTTAVASDDNDLGVDYKMLQGVWQSTEDAKYVMSFSDKIVYDIYEGQTDTTKASYSLSHTSCKNADDNPQHTYLLKKDVGGDMCYQLYTLTKDQLELINTDRGNRLNFRRK